MVEIGLAGEEGARLKQHFAPEHSLIGPAAGAEPPADWPVAAAAFAADWLHELPATAARLLPGAELAGGATAAEQAREQSAGARQQRPRRKSEAKEEKAQQKRKGEIF